jgi:acyl carrier protein
MFLSAACDGGDERTYLTGDLGRLDDDGCLFHLGRKDYQVNIRGYTIETLEIEHRLLKHPAVKAAAVVGRASDAGETILVGYYVPSSDAVPKADALGRFLRESLPSHMVPAKLVMLDALPLTPNGKIDRRMLPDPGRHRPALETDYVSPETEIETRLVEIWSAVLSLDGIGIHDNFFDLGGHSLAASQVISRVSQTFNLDVPLKALLDAPTIAQIAEVIAQAGDQIARTELDRLLSEIEAMPEDEARKQFRE